MKKIRRWVAVIMVCLLTLTGAEAVHAQTYSWMQTAKKVRINTVVKGVAQNNQKPDYSGRLAHALKRVQRMGIAV